MTQGFWRAILISLTVVFFSSCSKQQILPTLGATNTIMPSYTLQPTKTINPIPIKTVTPITTAKASVSGLCAKKPIPDELFASQPKIKSNKLIAFNTKGENSDIFTLEVNGSNLKRITKYSGADYMRQWLDDGKQILFSSGRDQGDCNNGDSKRMCDSFLFIMKADGSDPKKITPGSPYYPGQSSNGKYIAYEKEFYNEARLENRLSDYLSDMIVANINGSYHRNITKTLQPGGFFDAEWNPNSKYFAFLGVREPMIESSSNKYWPGYIYLVNADGTNLQKMEGGPIQYDSWRYKSWSLDGKYLAFLTAKGIAIVNADGSGFLEYLIEHNTGPREIFWSSDSQYLIFTDGDDSFYKINLDFTVKEKLPLVTESEKLLFRFQLLKTQILWDIKHDRAKILSPNGKWIAYFEDGQYPDDICHQIRVTNVETSESYFVIDDEAARSLSLNVLHFYPWSNEIFWSPDSSQLFFTQRYDAAPVYSEEQGLFAVSLDGTGFRLVAADAWNPSIQP